MTNSTSDIISLLVNATVELDEVISASEVVNDAACCENVSEEVVVKSSRIVSDIEGFERVFLWQIYALLGTVGFMSCFALIANGFVLFVLSKYSSLRKTKNLHFYILVVISLVNALVYYCYVVLTYFSNFAILDCVCVFFYGWAIEVIYNVSMTIMLGMCLERLISVVEPLWFSTVWMEEKYSLFLILAMLGVGVVPVVFPIVLRFVEYHHSRTWMYCRLDGSEPNMKAYIWINICFVYVPSIIGVVGVYIAVQVKATQARRITKQFREECKLKQQEKLEAEAGKMKKLRKALFNSRITIILLCLFVGTKLPIAILSYAHLFHMPLPFAVKNCEFIGNLCRFFFSVITPFLFPLLNTPLKNKLLSLICGGKARKTANSQKSTDLSSVDNTVKSRRNIGSLYSHSRSVSQSQTVNQTVSQTVSQTH